MAARNDGGDFLVSAGDPVENPSRLQGVEERRDGLPLGLRLLDELAGDIQAAGCRPFQDLRPVEAVLVLDPVGRDGLLLDPAIRREPRFSSTLSVPRSEKMSCPAPRCGNVVPSDRR